MTIGFVTDVLNGADQFTGDVIDDTQLESSIKGFDVEGPFNLSLIGTWTGDLVVQRRFVSDETNTWRDVNSFNDKANEYHDCETEGGAIYRVGFKAGETVTGMVNVRLST